MLLKALIITLPIEIISSIGGNTSIGEALVDSQVVTIA